MILSDKVKITSDSCCDLNLDILKYNNIDIAHLSICDLSLNEVYKDKVLSNEKLFELLNQGHTIKTSCPSLYEYEEMFKKALKEYENIVHLGMSSKMSSSYSVALCAKENLGSDKITVIDTKQLSIGLGLTVLNFNDYLKEVSSLKEALQLIKDDLTRSDINVVLQTPKYAFSGGRLEKASVPISSTMDHLGIRLNIGLKDGSFKPINIKYLAKYRGTSLKVASNQFNNILENIDEIDPRRIVLGATSNINEIDKIVEFVPNMQNITNIEKITVGTVITSHSGPNTFAMAYVRKRAL